MGLHHRIGRMERAIGSVAEVETSERSRAREFIAGLRRDQVKHGPEYRLVTREDCQDDEAWNEIRRTIAIADGNEREAARLASLPAPRKEARDAWIAQAPTLVGQVQRIGMGLQAPNPVKDALERAKARRATKGARA